MKTAKKSEPPGLGLIAADLEAVEKTLSENARSEVRLVLEVASHILGSGGKRFRPMLTLLTGKMLGFRREKELVSYAAAIEFSHTSTLLHDDVIDEAEIRRGAVSANRAFGNAASIIVGDYLLFKSYALMQAGENMAVVKLLSRVAVEMAEGEAYQLANKSRIDLTEDEYEKIIRSKTALLIQLACQVPALAAGVSKKEENALARFGYRLGLAFQMVDDVLDYTASDEGWGKAVGKDFMEAKTTLPLLLAYGLAKPAEKKLLKDLFAKPERTDKDLSRALGIIESTDAVNLANQRTRQNVARAKKQLSIFPDNPARRALIGLADYVVGRTV